jgi:hypothetical protein
MPVPDEIADANGLTGWLWEVQEWRGRRLLVIGDTDLTYHHTVEVEFNGVEYAALPSDFEDAHFRLASHLETEAIEAAVGRLDDDVTVWAIDAEGLSAFTPASFFVCATEVRVSRGLVYHYWPDSIAEGERVAPWIERPPAGPVGLGTRSKVNTQTSEYGPRRLSTEGRQVRSGRSGPLTPPNDEALGNALEW